VNIQRDLENFSYFIAPTRSGVMPQKFLQKKEINVSS
jgi:hypothetical protein